MLRKRDIDFTAKRISFLAKNRKGRIDRKEARVLPLVDFVESVLAQWTENLGDDDLVFPAPTDSNEPISRGVVRDSWRATCSLAGIEPPPRVHDLRHLTVSFLTTCGYSQPMIREFIGHKTDGMTSKYQHVKADDFLGMAESVSKGFSSMIKNNEFGGRKPSK